MMVLRKFQARRDAVERGRNVNSVLEQYGKFVKPAFNDFVLPSKKYADVIIPRGGDNHVAIDLIVQHIQTKLDLHELDLAHSYDYNENLEHKTEVPSVFKNSLRSDIHDNELGDLKKLDSFGRRMNKKRGKDCNDYLMASDSCSYWTAIDTQNDDKVASDMSQHIQLDVDSVAPSLSQEQLFNIHDFSLQWAYSGAETKVLISGVFLGGIQPSGMKWCCMFGEVEVSAEVVTTNAIRCQTPPHSPGRVLVYTTCNNRLTCSEARGFEYRENPPCTTFSVALKPKSG